MGRFLAWLVIHRFPVLSNPAACLFEVSSNINMLLLALNLCLHPSSSLSPFLHYLLGLLLSAFVGQLLIAIVEPDLLEFLLVHFARGVVEVVG